MNTTLKVAFAAAAATLLAFLPANATAANESAAVKTTVTPIAGKLFKEKRGPVQASVEATVTVPGGQTTILPLKQTRFRYDTDMKFVPDNRVTPVCGDDRINSQSDLANGVSFMVDLCPKSVVGTGTALIYLASLTGGPLEDPQMVLFNAGRNSRGEPAFKIYAYSKGTGVGVLMHGSLAADGEMTVDVPVLAFDSAVGNFKFEVPGRGMEVEDAREPDGFRTIKGLDPGYVRARCSTGQWTTNATLSLGKRDPSTGEEDGPTSVVDAPAFTDSCVGEKGRPRLVVTRKAFPKVLFAGRRAKFKVKVTNKGTASARKVALVARGGVQASRQIGKIPPGATRVIPINPRVKAPRGTKAKVTLVVKGAPRAGRTVKFSSRIRVR